jgi:hypothetical protein
METTSDTTPNPWTSVPGRSEWEGVVAAISVHIKDTHPADLEPAQVVQVAEAAGYKATAVVRVADAYRLAREADVSIDRTLIRPGRAFTSAQKRKIIAANRQRTGGRLRSDDPLDPYQDLSDPVKSVSPGVGGQRQDPAMAAVDHIVSRAAGGSNSYGNARVVSQYYNNLLRAKRAKASERLAEVEVSNG